MHRFRATPILAATLALLAALLFSSGAPAAPSAPLADIRQTTTPLDNFNRANENPILSPWVARFSGSGRGRIVNSQVINATTATWLDSHTTTAFDGDAAEVWATSTGVTDGSEFWYLGLLKDLNGTGVLDGYVARERDEAGGAHSWTILRYDDQVLTTIAGPTNHSPTLGNGNLAMLRREGNDVVVYQSQDAGANWTEKLRVADTTYTTGLYPGLGVGSSDATGPGWDNFGGGTGGTTPTQLTVVKNVVTDNGGSAVPSNWTMNVAGPTPLTFPGASTPGTTNTVQPGSYTVTESGGPAGYTLSYSGDCDAGGNVTLAAGQSQTCVLTNNDPASPSSPAGGSNGTTGSLGTLRKTGQRTRFDPVNTFTGFFIHNEQDLATPGTGVSFEWTRSYTSGDATVGPLGPGWTHTYAASLQVQANGDVLARGEEGQELYFTKQANGSFVGGAGALASLTSVAGGYELKRTDQVAYSFDASGRLLWIKDRNDQGVALAYDGSGRLATLIDAAGRQTTVSYNAQNLVSQVATAGGRSVSYVYTSGRLTSFTDVRAKVWPYTYDAAGRLATMVDPLNHTQVQNVYDTNGRVTSQTDALSKTTTFAWDAATQVATVTDANNKVWKDDYDQSVLAKEIDPLNNETLLAHDGELNETAVTSPTAQQTTMTYDAAGNLLTATAPPSLGSAQKTFVYNARNDPTQITDARSKVTSYTYTAAGNTANVTQDATQVGSYTYDAAGRVLTFTDGNEKTTTYTYDANGNLASSTDPLSNKTTYTYDAAGRVLTRVDPKGNCAGCTPANFTWTYTYNAAGQQLTESNPLGQVTTNAYDDARRLTSSTDANSHTTSYTYDNADRVLTETAPDPDGAGPLAAPVTTYTYDNVGNKLTETDPRGNTTTFAYDSANRLLSETGPDPDGAGPLSAPVTTQTYDANGNLASTVEPRGNASGANPTDYRTTYTYDAAGRLLTETRPDPDGAGPQIAPVTTNTYDPVGNLQSARDANNRLTSYTYDAAGRILTVTAPDAGVTTYTYDDVGNQLTRRDDNLHTTTFAYDDASRLASETSPDPDGPGPQGPAITSYTYDPNGNRLTVTDPNGNATGTAGDGVTTYAYDRGNRLTSVNYSDATPDVTFTYDNAGNRLTMADGSGSETRAYDNLDRLLSVTRGSNTFSYVYDAASNVTRRTHPGGTIADYAYDPLNRLASVASAGQTTSYGYDIASNLTQTTLPSGNGYVETRTYDRAGRLTEVNAQKGASVLSRFQSTLDPVGNPTQIVRTGALSQTQTYTYDASDRILSVCFQAGTCPGGSDPFIRWTYDKVGNRLSEQRPGAATTNYSYDARDRLLSAGATSYSYDQNGNELSAGSRTFTYDLANRLKTTTQASTTTTYLYDGDGARLQASTGTQASKKTNFLWDVNDGLPQVALERDGNNALLRRYVYGVRRISQTAGSSTSYYLSDGLGSTANLTSSSGATQWTWSYEPFGSIRTETKASGNQPTNFMRFTGEYLDPTGLYHLRARQYDPTVGRFLQQDPVTRSAGYAHVATYAYSDCRPTVFVDPSGEFRGEPNETGEEAAGFAASRLQAKFLTLERKKGPAYPCILPPSVYLDLLANSGQLFMTGHFPNPATALRRVFGEVSLGTTKDNRRKTHSFDISKTRFNISHTLWAEPPVPFRGGIKFVTIRYVANEPANPATAIHPDDDKTFGSVRATARHAKSGGWIECVYAGRFGARR